MFTLVTLAILATGCALLGSYETSIYCLRKAEKSISTSEKVRYLETAKLFWETRQIDLALGEAQYKLQDYHSAAENYAAIEDKDGFDGFAKSIYALGRYSEVVETANNHPDRLTDQSNTLLAKSYLKLGDLSNSRKVLARIPLTAEVQDLRIALFSKVQTEGTTSDFVSRFLTDNNPANQYILAFNELETRGFPQAAMWIINQSQVK